MAHRGHGDGTIFERKHKRKDGTAVTRYTALLPVQNGKRPSLGTYKTKAEARQALRDAEVQRAQGTLVTGKAPTVRAWCQSWLDGRTRIAYQTRRGYESVFQAVMPYIGDIRLSDLQESDIARMWEKLAQGVDPDGKPRRGGPLAATTLDRCHRNLSTALRAAVQSRRIPIAYNPAAATEAKPEAGTRKPINPLTEDEVQRLFEATAQDREFPLWVALITTGMRHAEAQALHWKDVDLVSGTIAVRYSLHRELDKGWVFGPTKTKRDRRIDLRPHVVEVLRKHRARQAERRLKAGPVWEDFDLVFSTDTGHPLDQRRIQRLFDEACEKAGVERRTIKETRHTFATLGLLHNVPVKVISEALGHASVMITLNVYSHVIAGFQRDSLAHLDTLFA